MSEERYARHGRDRTQPIELLYVGSDGESFKEVADRLGRFDDRFHVRAAVESHGAPTFDADLVDCVVVDRSLGASAPGFVDAVRVARPTLPVVVWTPSSDLAADALAAGADGCVVGEDEPGLLERLANRVETAVRLDRAEGASADRRRPGGRASAVGTIAKERAIDAAPVGVVLTDPSREDNPIVYANDRFERLTGYPVSEVVGRNCRLLQGPGTDPESVAELRAGIDDERRVSVTLRNYRRDGSPFWNQVVVAPLYDRAGELVNYVGFQTDVTGAREREEALQEVYELVSDPDRPFEEKVDGLLSIGRRVLRTEYATVSRVEDDRYTFEVVQAPDDRIEEGTVVPISVTNCERVVRTEHTLVLDEIEADAPELASRAGNVEFGLARYVGAPVLVDGDVHGTICFYDSRTRDEPFSAWEVTFVDLLSQWVTAEQERERLTSDLLERNERLEEVTRVLSHDLQNPLEVAEARLRFAREEYEDEHLEKVALAHDRMRTMIDDLLALAREDGVVTETEPVSLAETAERCWAGLRTDEATLRVETDLVVRAEPVRAERLLENLLCNAVDHGGPGVTVVIEAVEEGFAVADDGQGVPERIRERIFESGFTTGDGGSGLGLAIVERIADAHGWRLAVEPREEGGTRVVVSGVETV